MTASEAASRLGFGAEGVEALGKLCQKGCDPGVLCGLLIYLTAPPVELPRRAARDRSAESESVIAGKDPLGVDPFYQNLVEQQGKGAVPTRDLSATDPVNPRLTRSGLEIEGGFGPCPEEPQRSDSTARLPEPQSGRGKSFKARQFKQLAESLKDLSGEIRQLQAASLWRQVRRGSLVLRLALPDKLDAYAENVIPALMARRRVLVEPQGELVNVEDSTTSGAAAATDPPIDGDEAASDANERQVSFRALDSRQEALGSVEVRRLKPLQKKVTKVVGRLRELHATPAGEIIVERFPAFWGLPMELDVFAETLLAMLDVPVGPKRRPASAHLLWELFIYVKQQTGSYRDDLVAQILDDKGFILGPADSIDANALRKWRLQHPRSTR